MGFAEEYIMDCLISIVTGDHSKGLFSCSSKKGFGIFTSALRPFYFTDCGVYFGIEKRYDFRKWLGSFAGYRIASCRRFFSWLHGSHLVWKKFCGKPDFIHRGGDAKLWARSCLGDQAFSIHAFGPGTLCDECHFALLDWQCIGIQMGT